jgi:integrase
MAKNHSENARKKYEYLRFLKEARGRDEKTLDRVAASLARFEETTGRKDFKRFHREQAVAFKRKLADRQSLKTGGKLSKATMLATLRDLKDFFEWLSREPGYRSSITYSDADYFNLSDKDVAIARARREKQVPTLQQVDRVLEAMPATTALERRDRALIAFAAITGARVNALASLRLDHINIEEGFIDQDARTVRTKFGKTFRTYLMPVSNLGLSIAREWVKELREDHLWAGSDPLFPATQIGIDAQGGFAPKGLSRTCWASTGPIRDIFRKGFERIGLPYYNPHSFRDMIVRHVMTLGLTPEEMKAWSQNLGHNDVLTTFTSYGQVPAARQGELIRAITERSEGIASDPDVLALIRKIKEKAA